MSDLLVMTAIGKDRPGLVDLLAGTIARHGGNWLESRMSHLGGQFAGILRIRVPVERQEALGQSLQQLKESGLTVEMYPDPDASPAGERASMVLELVGQDRPGIVQHISHSLASLGVNVEELETECESAPMSGETLFKAQVKLGLPSPDTVAALRSSLEKIAADLMVDVSLSELGEE